MKPIRFILALAAITWFQGVPEVNAQDVSEVTRENDPAKTACISAALPVWSPLEIAVWRENCEGRPALINRLATEPLASCPFKQPHYTYPDGFRLSSAFLQRVLRSDLVEKLPPAGLRITCARFSDPIVLDNFTLKRPVSINRSQFGSYLHMRGTIASHDISLRQSWVAKALLADEMRSAGSLLLRGVDVGQDLNLTGAKIQGRIYLDGSSVGGSLLAEGVQVGSHFELRGGGPYNRVSLVRADIHSFLQLRGSLFEGDVDLTGARIQGELHLASVGETPPAWGDTSALILRNTEVTALQDLQEHWPKIVDLVGFRYELPSGLRGGGSVSLADRSVSELLAWLRRQSGYGLHHYAQPYEQLAHVLKSVGRDDKARAIQFWGKWDEMWADSTSWSDTVWLAITGLTIGFGIYPGISGVWIAVLTGMSWKVVATATYPKGRRPTAGQAFWFSLDMSVPVVSIGGKPHDDLFEKMDEGSRRLIYLQKLLAFVLFTFFAAGISGLIN